jgi:hypothetical protein
MLYATSQACKTHFLVHIHLLNILLHFPLQLRIAPVMAGRQLLRGQS